MNSNFWKFIIHLNSGKCITKKMISAEQREYAEESIDQRIVENNRFIIDFQMSSLLEKILKSANINNAY